MDFYTIDSGKKGAIVLFVGHEPLCSYMIPYDETGDFIDLEALVSITHRPVYIEKITPYAPNSNTIATQFQAYGALVSGAKFRSSHVELVPVPTWQGYARKQKGYPPRSKWSKSDSIALAEAKWPEFCKSTMSKRQRILSDGIADSLVLGMYVIDENRLPNA